MEIQYNINFVICAVLVSYGFALLENEPETFSMVSSTNTIYKGIHWPL